MLFLTNQVLRKKVKLLRKDCKFVAIIILLGALSFIGCSTRKVKLEVPVGSVQANTDFKKGYEVYFFTDSLKGDVLRKFPNGDYLLSYELTGLLKKENPYHPVELKKVLLSEDTDGDIKIIKISLVSGYFFGKTRVSEKRFHFKNEYLLKNDPDKTTRKILFSSGDKEYILELP